MFSFTFWWKLPCVLWLHSRTGFRLLEPREILNNEYLPHRANRKERRCINSKEHKLITKLDVSTDKKLSDCLVMKPLVDFVLNLLKTAIAILQWLVMENKYLYCDGKNSTWDKTCDVYAFSQSLVDKITRLNSLCRQKYVVKQAVYNAQVVYPLI